MNKTSKSWKNLKMLSRMVGGKSNIWDLLKELGIKGSYPSFCRWFADEVELENDLYFVICEGIRYRKTPMSEELRNFLEETYKFLTEMMQTGVITPNKPLESVDAYLSEGLPMPEEELKMMEDKFKIVVTNKENTAPRPSVSIDDLFDEDEEVKPSPSPSTSVDDFFDGDEEVKETKPSPSPSVPLDDLFGGDEEQEVKEPVKEQKKGGGILDQIISQSQKPVVENHISDPFEKLESIKDVFDSEEAKI